MSDNQQIMQELIPKLESYAAEGTTIGEDTDLAEALALDSMKLINLSLELEDEFDISVPLEELANVNTARELAELIVRRQNQQS